MKILFYVASFGRGGAERVIANLIERLFKNGDEPILVTDYLDPPNTYPLPLEVRRYFLDERTKSRSRFFKNINRIKSLKKVVTDENPDLVVSFLGYANRRALLALKRRKCKMVVSVRNDPNREYGSRSLTRKITNHLFKRADGVVCQTEEQPKYFSKKVQGKVKIIINPVNEAFRNTQWHGQNSKEILAVGRLGVQKNYPLLLEAFLRVSKIDDSLTLNIYGSDSGKQDEILSFIEQNNLESKVVLKGNQSDLREAYAGCRFYVLPSSWEGLPNSLMEAMTVGAPCIATDCDGGGSSYLLGKSEYGILTKNGDVEELTDAMIKMSSDDDLRLRYAEAAHERSHDFDSEKIFSEWIEYFKSMINDENNQN